MAIDPLAQPQPTALQATKLPSLLRALADPEGKGGISADSAALIGQIETNLARYRNSS
jgi:hypothetical protein